jgi:hypothetical protein
MSLETFIGRNVVDMGQVIQAMETDVNPPDQDDSQMNNEAITTEDILGKNETKFFHFSIIRIHLDFLLGNISESDSSDDDDAAGKDGMDD